MQLRGLLIAAVVLAGLAGGVWYSNKVEKEKEGKPSPTAAPKIAEIPADQIRQVDIAKTGGESVTLRRGEGDKWELTAPKQLRADQDAVSSLVGTFSSLSSDRLIEEKAADVAPYGLSAPKITVTVTKKDGKTTKLLIGDETPTTSGFFVRLDGDPRVFTLASWNKSSIDKSWKDLQDKRLLTFDSDKLSRLELTVKGQTVEFGKNNKNEWQIVRPKPMRADGGQVEELVRKLRDAKMDTAVTDEEVKKSASVFASATVVATARVTDAAGTQQIEVRKDKDNNYYARSNAVEGVHKATSDLGDGLNKSVDDFRNKKLFDFGWTEVSKVAVRDGDKSATYEKRDDKWMAGNKQMDSTSVQNLIDKLRDLAAAKFHDAGFTTSVFEATVTSDSGKRVERVLISKAGDKYMARRDNEPSVYEIEPNLFKELATAAGDVKEPPPPKKEEKKK
jgi:hypothetical protein